jgi:hypothetical protein
MIVVIIAFEQGSDKGRFCKSQYRRLVWFYVKFHTLATGKKLLY